jgi:hypothetical protein
MRLSELQPKWLEVEGRRLGFVFRCPHCRTEWLSCFFTPMPHIAGDDYHDCQYALFLTVLPDVEAHEVVPCKRDYAWSCSPPVDQATFENLSVTPSLDASKSGHWHGHITAGEIR